MAQQQQQKAKAKGRKIGRNKKHQATIYKQAMRLERNKKRKMRRHLQDHPDDVQGYKRYAEINGKPAADQIALTMRGLKRKSGEHRA